MKPLRAFHNKQSIKDKYLARVLAHYKADEIIKGRYWKDGKGCAVGCTIHSSDYNAYETELGIPEWLARVEDRIFEGLPDKRAKTWPKEFLSAIQVGADLDKIKNPFLVFVLRSTLETFDRAQFPQVKTAVNTVIDLCETNEPADSVKWAAAAASAAEARAAAAAAWTAAAVVEAVAEGAGDAVAWAVDAADSTAAYVKFADELLRLLKENHD